MASKGTAKRDALRANEIKIQAEWEAAKVFESDAADPNQEKFIVTFPFPYSNGHLHIGHAFSLTKSVFRAQFERHQGKNVLFPFAFHCTGMPIQAVRYNVSNPFLVSLSQNEGNEHLMKLSCLSLQFQHSILSLSLSTLGGQ